MIRRMQAKPLWWRIAIVIVIAIGVVRIAATHRVFSEVLDEPVHIACGYDWLKGVPYTSDPSHPPLERVLSAFPALLQHVPVPNDPYFVARGNAILYFQDHYEHNLARARMANLLFFILAAVSVAAWGTRLFGPATGLVATALFTYLPPILGHAGVATTDMAAAASVAFAILVLEWWLDAPSPGRGAMLGMAIGIGLLSKFSFLFFFPIAAAIVILIRRKLVRPLPILVTVMVAGLVLWAGYRFSFGTITSALDAGRSIVDEGSPKPLRPIAGWFADHVPIPAPLFAVGAALVKIHDQSGHVSYLFGETSEYGWWYYFPVVFFFKTPLPFLLFFLVAFVLIPAQRHKAVSVVLIPIAFMLAVVPSSINIGIRHLLPIYPPLCIAAAHGAVVLWRFISMRVVVIALAAWMMIGVDRSHPDYLAWFNEAAGEHPERIAADSNLDWGQDVLRLAQTIRRLKIGSFRILYLGNALLERHGLHSYPIIPWFQAPGWYALSETALALDNTTSRRGYDWLDDYRMFRVGKSIRLYHVPQLAVTKGAPDSRDKEEILLPIAGTLGVVGAPVGVWFHVDQTIRNIGTRRIRVLLSSCTVNAPSCMLELEPEHAERLAARPGQWPFILVTIPRGTAKQLAFSTVVHAGNWPAIEIPAVSEKAFQQDRILIPAVPTNARLNLRVWLRDSASSAPIVVRLYSPRDGRLIAARHFAGDQAGYFANGNLGPEFAGFLGEPVNVEVESSGAKVWAMMSTTDYRTGKIALSMPR